MGFSGDRHIHMGLLKERCVHIENRDIFGLYNKECFFRFVCSYISLSGSLSLLREP
jgi:hypothetical protein